jgi:hypothetical protein
MESYKREVASITLTGQSTTSAIKLWIFPNILLNTNGENKTQEEEDEDPVIHYTLKSQNAQRMPFGFAYSKNSTFITEFFAICKT